MPLTFIGKTSGIAALVGCMFIVILTAFGDSFIRAFRADDEAISTYAEQMTLGEALEEAVQRKLADGRGYLLVRDEGSRLGFERAAADEKALLAELRSRVKSPQGIRLLDVTERADERHDRALREAMAMQGTTTERAAIWSKQVVPLAVGLRESMDAFIRHKRALYEESKQAAYRAQRRALFTTISITLLALFAGVAGGIYLLRSARTAFELQTKARTAAETERAFCMSLLDQIPIGIVAAEASGRIIHVNKRGRQLLMLDEPAARELRLVADLVEWPIRHLDGSACALDDLPLARALHGELVNGVELSGPKGTIYSTTAGPIRDGSGRTVAAVAAFADVTEKKHAERERQLFLGALGHDLRNPLNAISLATDSLRRFGDLPDAAAKPAARIAASVDRMNRLIGELLDFARCQHGSLPIKPERCELKQVAAEIVGEISVAHPDRQIRIDAERGCDGWWDSNRMAQVFQNLIGNAVEHGVPDQPIEVQAGCASDVAWVRVTNSGRTIPPEELPRIFEPFRTTGESKGLGLGLYIARAIVVAHGGRITVESKEGTTTFVVEVPRQSMSSNNQRDEQQPRA